jgi:hypothetical protein
VRGSPTAPSGQQTRAPLNWQSCGLGIRGSGASTETRASERCHPQPTPECSQHTVPATLHGGDTWPSSPAPQPQRAVTHSHARTCVDVAVPRPKVHQGAVRAEGRGGTDLVWRAAGRDVATYHTHKGVCGFRLSRRSAQRSSHQSNPHPTFRAPRTGQLQQRPNIPYSST